jgi:hypothetical protein
MDKKTGRGDCRGDAYISKPKRKWPCTCCGHGRGGAPAGFRPAGNLWGLSGRQAMMQMRNLMQMKRLSRGAFEVR